MPGIATPALNCSIRRQFAVVERDQLEAADDEPAGTHKDGQGNARDYEHRGCIQDESASIVDSVHPESKKGFEYGRSAVRGARIV